MYYFIISKKENTDFNEKNSVCLTNIEKSDFVLTRTKKRTMIGQFALVGSIEDFNDFKAPRKLLYNWTKESRKFYLHMLMLKRTKDDKVKNSSIYYEITGFEEAYIVNFGEDYNNTTGNKMNLIMNQKSKTAIGVVSTNNFEVEDKEIKDIEDGKSRFKMMSSEKLSKMIGFLEEELGGGE